MENKLSEVAIAEHLTALLCTGGVLVYLIKTYSNFNIDIALFIVFAVMCYAGYCALKAAQDIAISIENNKNLKYNNMKTNMHIITGVSNKITPCAFRDNTKFSKYATYSRTYKMAS